MIKNATFTSVWDGGYEITSGCKVNTETKEVFDIETIDVGDDLDVLEFEFITVDNIEYPVSNDGTTEYRYN